MNKFSDEEIQAKVELLEEARELIEEAVEKIKDAVYDTPKKERARAYIIPVLEMCCYEETDFLGKQPANIEELIEAITKLEIEEGNED